MSPSFTTQQSSASTAIIRFLVKGAITFACLQATIIYLQMIGIAPSNHDTFVTTGTFGNPAPAGGFLAICASLALHRSVYTTKRCPWGAITCYLLVACALTDSRAALLGFIVAAMMVLFVRFRIPSKRLKYAIFIGLPIVGVLLVAGMYLYRPQSADGRLLIWKICVKHIIAEKPLFGHGMGNFHREYMPAQATYFASGRATEAEMLLASDNTHAFNEFIRIACEYGIMGVLLSVLLLFVIIYSGVNEFTSLRGGAVVALVCGVIFACFSYPSDVPLLCLLYATLIVCTLPPLPLDRRKRCIFHIGIALMAIVLLTRYTSCGIRYLQMEKALSRLLVSDDKDNKAYIKSEIANFADNGRILSRYAYTLCRKGQYRDAIPALERSISLFPTAAKVLELGDAYKETEQYDKATECYETAANMLPAYITPPYKLFSLYEELGMGDRALEYAEHIDTMKVKVTNKRTESIKNNIHTRTITKTHSSSASR